MTVKILEFVSFDYYMHTKFIGVFESSIEAKDIDVMMFNDVSYLFSDGAPILNPKSDEDEINKRAAKELPYFTLREVEVRGD